MDPELILADPEGRDVCAAYDFTLDVGFGTDENSFTLTLLGSPAQPGKGWYAYMDGTEYGGVVDAVEADTSTGEVTYTGRSWHGMLAGKVLAPDPGADYLTVSGDARSALDALIRRCGLGAVFSAPAGGAAHALSGSYSFDRYTDAYTGIRKMLAASGLKLSMRREAGSVALRADPVASYGDDVDSDRIEFRLKRTWRPVNHLVCLGTGELRDRAVVDLYADSSGAVSRTQTLFGPDERAEVYDYTGAGAEELAEKGAEKLADMQGQGSLEVTVTDGAEYSVGDVLTGRYALTGETVSATVTKKIAKVEGGTLAVSYECGTSVSTASSISSTSEAAGSGGGHAYYAGEGLRLSNYTFSADVTQAALDAVSARAQAAEKSASDAAAAVGGKVSAVTGNAPVTAARSGDAVAIGIAAATASSPGAMAAADKAKLDGIEAGANRYVLPPASATGLGGVRPDGATVTVDADGTLHASVSAAGASFLAAHPVGCVYLAEAGDPSEYGGSWEPRPTIGPFAWARTG